MPLKRALVLVGSCFIFISSLAQAAEIETPGEKCRFSRYSQHEEITLYLSQVDHASHEVIVQIIGRTQETENYAAKDLYLCILTEEGADCPRKLDRKKPTLLLFASQHGNEQSAKEAVLQVIRDVAFGELKPLLTKVNILIIPQANPYGTWRDLRRNEQDLDLNRDHVKLESPEVEAIHHVFRTWMPEVTLDIHEKGEYYYKVTFGCVSNPNIHSDLQKYSRSVILEEIERDLKKINVTFQEYMPSQEMGFDSSAGVTYLPKDPEEEEDMRRFSTTDINDGRNSLGIYETLSFIQEGASQRDIKTLEERTHWQYWGIRLFAESIARHGGEVLSLVRSLRKQLADKANTFAENDTVHLRMIFVRDDNQPILRIKKFESAEDSIRGILKEDKKSGEIIASADLDSYPYPSDLRVVEDVIENWFPGVKPTLSVSRPLGYIIPAQHLEVVETLLRHDIAVETFARDFPVEIEAYVVKDVIPSDQDYDPPQSIAVEKKKLQTIVNRGDFYVSCAQDGANLIPCLLEPQSLYGFIRYWKYNLVPDVGDFFPFFRVIVASQLPLFPYKRWKR
jgi:hypothetical protein